MKMKFYLIVFLIGLCSTKGIGQQFSISGKVTSSDGSPLADAQVFIQSTSKKTTTDINGYFQLSDIQSGAYEVGAFSVGFQSQLRRATIGAKNITLNFTLSDIEKMLDEVTIKSPQEKTNGLTRLNAVEGAAIYEGKKNEVIVLKDINANLATNNARQIYSKVPGLNVWESDRAGLQLGIGGRGLSPDRTSNFNTRQNGYDISADPLGYPESYYTPPPEAVESIEIVRGAASLQYGTQFGGMLNFVMNRGPEDKPIELTTRQTVGSYGLFNSFNSIGGTKGTMDYYAFYQYKRGDGWRPNSSFESHTAFADFNFQLTDRLFLCVEYTHMEYDAQQPGGLTDAQFRRDPRQSNRARNWFNVNWNLGAVILEYKFTDRTKIRMHNFGLYAQRDALGNLTGANRADLTLERDLIRDDFKNFGNETRLMHHYNFLGRSSVILVGTRYYKGFSHKLQGKANTGEGPEFEFLEENNLQSDHDFPSQNMAVFAENIFNISDKISVTPGIRFENIKTEADGYYSDTTLVRGPDGFGVDSTFQVPDNLSRYRSFVLFGLGLSYKKSPSLEIYGNISQNYRAINFTDLRTVNEGLIVDENIHDERGFNADLGARGKSDILNYDVSVFYLKYNDRIGPHNTSVPDPFLVRRFVRVRRNIADARIIGIESFLEANIYKLFQPNDPNTGLYIFSNVALIDGKYDSPQEKAFDNKKVELIPTINLKSGITFDKNNFSATYQFTYIGDQFTDATNAELTPNAVDGLIPAYHVMDLSLKYTYKFLTLETGINNLTDNIYFTRRAEAYPGPGIIPADGRNYFATLQMKF